MTEDTNTTATENKEEIKTIPIPTNVESRNILFLMFLYFQNSTIQNSVQQMIEYCTDHINKAKKEDNQDDLIYWIDVRKQHKISWQKINEDLTIFGEQINNHPAYDMFIVSITTQEFFNEIVTKDIRETMDKFKTRNALQNAWENFQKTHSAKF